LADPRFFVYGAESGVFVGKAPLAGRTANRA
jgi:hypothetical protein